MNRLLQNNSYKTIIKNVPLLKNYTTTTTTFNSSSTNIMMKIDEVNFKEKNKVTVFSGMQPTSSALHLGNYLGAMNNWLKIQDLVSKNNQEEELLGLSTKPNEKHKLIFSIVDLHSLTATKSLSPKDLQANTISVAINYLACGIDPEKVILFNQSMVPAHSELTWILNCITSFSKLGNMIQFKEKTKTGGASVSNGLLSYPVLMAADILLYRATHVPVGEDQTQHLEFTRDIAQAFHSNYKSKFFPYPSIISSEQSKRIMSLQDGRSKMSKSDPLENSRISLTDSDDQIRLKIKKSKTDTIIGITYDPINRPDISNLLSIASATSGIPIIDLESEFKDKSNSVFKEFLSNSIIKNISPIREKINYYQSNPQLVRDILLQGSEKANKIANKNLNSIKDIVGLYH
ncbi:hypothetical protein RB653_001888 [Dictyostelium firmibasis]|uniref:tryptophan--tRNA ligase n=1 Tax=Dictyostelium firmibasis TaxID=79012 RepID=A0AAN7YS59_9MYCE